MRQGWSNAMRQTGFNAGGYAARQGFNVYIFLSRFCFHVRLELRSFCHQFNQIDWDQLYSQSVYMCRQTYKHTLISDLIIIIMNELLLIITFQFRPWIKV